LAKYAILKDDAGRYGKNSRAFTNKKYVKEMM
jgi:hypothetical protein